MCSRPTASCTAFSITSPSRDIRWLTWTTPRSRGSRCRVGFRSRSAEKLQPEARIIELNVLKAPDESLFAITEVHPLLKTVFVTEQDARAHILDAAPMVWPKIHEGQAVGLASIYVCIDREGRVRETHNLNNDHPDVADSAREQVMHWRFRQFMAEGVPVQAETILRWAYSTELE